MRRLGWPFRRRLPRERRGARVHSTYRHPSADWCTYFGLSNLERFDILQTVNNTTADLEVLGSLVKPTPPLQGARTDAPPARKLNLIEVSDVHSALRCIQQML